MSTSTRSRILLLMSSAMVSTMFSAAMLAEDLGRTEAEAWSFDVLGRHAQQCAGRPFEVSPALPAELRKLDYDSYRLIAFGIYRGVHGQ